MADEWVEIEHPELKDAEPVYVRPYQVEHYKRSGWKPVPKSRQNEKEQ